MITVSSAYDVESRAERGQSLIYKRNNKASRQDPYGTLIIRPLE